MAVQYKLESFEGPLDLLLHLIEQSEVDIYDIPISTITDQFLEYVGAMQQLELDAASEFLVMAATLLSIKSRMLLPKPPAVVIESDEEDGIDPRAELVQRLIEYRKYKDIAEQLRAVELQRSLIYTREPDDLSEYTKTSEANPLVGLRLIDLVLAFQKAVKKASSRNIVSKIRRDGISVKDRMAELLAGLIQNGGKLLFSKLLGEPLPREHIVVTFLALLELMKLNKITCYQHRRFDDIVIQAKELMIDDLSGDEIHY